MLTDNPYTDEPFSYGSGEGTGAGLLETGQETSYHPGDDGDLKHGIAHSYDVLTTGQYAGTTDITINGKTLAMSNACVKDKNTGIFWAREVPQDQIGTGTDGKLFWEAWTLRDKTDISFQASNSTIHSGASDFSIEALCIGRKFSVTGSTDNDGTYTVTAITTSQITVSESLTEESTGATISIETVGDVIWNVVDQANGNLLAGYNDWFVPNSIELFSIVDESAENPEINPVVFPSTPNFRHWNSTSFSVTVGKNIDFSNGIISYKLKTTFQYYLRIASKGGL